MQRMAQKSAIAGFQREQARGSLFGQHAEPGSQSPHDSGKQLKTLSHSGSSDSLFRRVESAESTVPRGSHVRLDRERPNLTIDEVQAICPPSEWELDEVVWRLGSSRVWKSRRMILHRTHVWFLIDPDQIVADSIALSEIQSCELAANHDDPVKFLQAFSITTGSTVIFCRVGGAEGSGSAAAWVERISSGVEQLQKGPTRLEAFQSVMRRIEHHPGFTLAASFLILTNFAFICAESQKPPEEGSAWERNLRVIDIVFCICFTLEIWYSMSVGYRPVDLCIA